MNPSTPVRIPDELMARARALLPHLEGQRQRFGWRRVTVTAIIRLALERGLDALVAEVEEEIRNEH